MSPHFGLIPVYILAILNPTSYVLTFFAFDASVHLRKVFLLYIPLKRSVILLIKSR